MRAIIIYANEKDKSTTYISFVDGIKFPAGSNINIFTRDLHMNETYFPEPQHFMPERFLPENCEKRHKYMLYIKSYNNINFTKLLISIIDFAIFHLWLALGIVLVLMCIGNININN